MTYKIEPYTKERIGDVKAFNQRLKKGNAKFSFPETHISDRWPRISDDRQLFEEYYLVVENEQNVRGGYLLKTQNFINNGELLKIGNIQLPLSEGSIDKAHNIVGIKIVKDALKKNPFLYALGMGGKDKPFPLLLKSLGWKMVDIPFYFKILRPKKFFTNIQTLRNNFKRRIAMNILGFSGIGWLGVKCHELFSRGFKLKIQKANFNETKIFDDWATALWKQDKDNYAFCAVRDKKTLNILYPSSDKKMLRLKFSKDGNIIGWLLVLVTQMNADKYFGNMKVGSIIDGYIAQGFTNDVIGSVVEFFNKKKADLIVSNQSYNEYAFAFKENGFVRGPSNFVFAASKKLSAKLNLNDNSKSWINFHINRGDGDGPMHL